MMNLFEQSIVGEQAKLKQEILLLKEQNESLKSRIENLFVIRNTTTTKYDAASQTPDWYDDINNKATHPNENVDVVKGNLSNNHEIYPIAVNISNRYDALQDSSSPDERSTLITGQQFMQQESINISQDQLSHDKFEEPWQQPKNKARRSKPVFPEADHLIIGDSVLAGIYGNKMSRNDGEIVSVYSMSGAKLDDITDKINSLPLCQRTTMITVHAGINDSLRNAKISMSQLQALKSKIHRILPKSKIHISSIIPPCSGHQRSTVDYNNEVLRRFCARNDMLFIDNTPYFVARSGAPVKRLYKDQFHTNNQGSSTLALNIKYPERTLKSNMTDSYRNNHVVDSMVSSRMGNSQTIGKHTVKKTTVSPNPGLYNYEDVFPSLPIKKSTLPNSNPWNTRLSNGQSNSNRSHTTDLPTSLPYTRADSPDKRDLPSVQSNSNVTRTTVFPTPTINARVNSNENCDLLHLLQFNPSILQQALLLSLGRHLPAPYSDFYNK
jgi:hypothetical protein